MIAEPDTVTLAAPTSPWQIRPYEAAITATEPCPGHSVTGDWTTWMPQ
jgi:hypothetical protein